MNSWTADEHGNLLGVGYHDGSVFGLSILEDRLSISIKNTANEVVDLVLSGVTYFTVDKLWNGAIVSDIFCWKVGRVPEAVWAIPDGAWPVLLNGRASEADRRMVSQRIVSENPEAILVQISCSYGGDLVAVCDVLEVNVGRDALGHHLDGRR